MSAKERGTRIDSASILAVSAIAMSTTLASHSGEFRVSDPVFHDPGTCSSSNNGDQTQLDRSGFLDHRDTVLQFATSMLFFARSPAILCSCLAKLVAGLVG
jgi:hypothetical protein